MYQTIVWLDIYKVLHILRVRYKGDYRLVVSIDLHLHKLNLVQGRLELVSHHLGIQHVLEVLEVLEVLLGENTLFRHHSVENRVKYLLLSEQVLRIHPHHLMRHLVRERNLHVAQQGIGLLNHSRQRSMHWIVPVLRNHYPWISRNLILH